MALKRIFRQMELNGNRARTIDDYQKYMNNFIEVCNIVYISDITIDSIYEWLETMGSVQNSTKEYDTKLYQQF